MHLQDGTEASGRLAAEMLARSPSLRDIQDAFQDGEGRLLLS